MTRRTIAGADIALMKGDITTCTADAIVNAANTALAGGGGVDGAIHRAGGPAIAAACRKMPFLSRGVKCPTGEARSTTAGNLNATWVIHTVGPIYDSRDQVTSEVLLASAYRSSLEEAVRLGARSVAFPSLSTGAFRFPLRPAARIALTTIASFLGAHQGDVEQVSFALFSDKDLEVFTMELETLTP